MADEPVATGGRSSSMGEVFNRVNHVEREIGQVKAEIAGMNSTLANQGQTLARIATTLEQNRGTDWKAIASWATVTVVIIGAGASLVLAPMRSAMDSNRIAIDRLAEARLIDQRAALESSQKQLEKAEESGRYKERVDRLDRELARAHELLKLRTEERPP